MTLPIHFGTDIGPKHHCGGTIYAYNAREFRLDDGATRCTILATCVCCGGNAGIFGTNEMPPDVKTVRALHVLAVTVQMEGGSNG